MTFWLLDEAYKFNEWRQKARKVLLTDIAPRIYALSQAGYWGCGFHYDKEHELGTLIKELALPAQFTASHTDKIPKDRTSILILRVKYDCLLERVEDAEWSVGKTIEECQARDEAKKKESAAKLKELLEKKEN